MIIIKYINSEKFININKSSDNLFSKEDKEIDSIFVTNDKKIEFVRFKNNTLLMGIKSSFRSNSYYNIHDLRLKKVKNILMDMDGTTMLSEKFWVEMLRISVVKVTKDDNFKFSDSDFPYISGHSVTEHLSYCIDKYKLKCKLFELKKIYDDIVDYNLDNLELSSNAHFFEPREGLKNFLLKIKEKGIKIALVSSGSTKKVTATLNCVFKNMNMGNPLDYYDCIITGGDACKKLKYGTIGELYAKPYPCLYEEAYYIGLGLTKDDLEYTIAIEDSASGIYSILSSNITPIGISGGNIKASGVEPLCYKYFKSLEEIEEYFIDNK